MAVLLGPMTADGCPTDTTVATQRTDSRFGQPLYRILKTSAGLSATSSITPSNDGPDDMTS